MDQDQQELPPLLVGLDFETEGLYEQTDTILECAVIHVDAQTLEEQSRAEWFLTERSNTTPHPAVTEMHRVSGLFDLIDKERRAGVTFAAADLDIELLKYFQSISPQPGRIMLFGNGIGQFDVRFMRRYTPKALKHLHYRVLDTSGMIETHKLWYGPMQKPERAHRALADILQSLAALQFQRRVCQAARRYDGIPCGS
jgi:oligoribonuclease (3'-5' exoribonuclease)